jgi:hypothetical protein
VPTEIPGVLARVASDALVIRFRPTDPDRVLRIAALEFRRIGRYRLSVFAAAKRPGETDATLRRRLLEASELAGMDPANNPKFYVCAEAGELLERGFVFYKDGDDDERDEHYSVDLGADATREDVERFLGAFGPAEKRSEL